MNGAHSDVVIVKPAGGHTFVWLIVAAAAKHGSMCAACVEHATSACRCLAGPPAAAGPILRTGASSDRDSPGASPGTQV